MMHMNQLVYHILHGMHWELLDAQMQVPDCRHEPVDSTDTNIVVTLSCLETTQQKKKKKW